MKKLLTSIALGASLALATLAVHAADKAPTAQQNKMTTCNADPKAKTLKGDERKAFMKECLSAGSVAATPMTQQDKMKTCNADTKAKTLKGDDRKAFMKECLSGKAA
ncbi:Phosphate starvation-inducible protein PsiF [Burkholderiales bacterium 8X]|nr:Phosphate starvation-inducible protein PsiF [Burkholderiales bacterium 8X]